MSLKTLLRELRTEVKRVDPPAVATLRPSLSRSEVERKLAALPYAVTPGAGSLYEWADGSDGQFQLLPGGYFRPLSHVLRRFKAFHAYADEIDEEDEPYRDCFRFLDDWSDGGYAFGRVDAPAKGRIIKLCIHAMWLPAFNDLEHLLETSLNCYRQGVMRRDDGSPDFTGFYALARRINRGFKVWRSGS